MCKTFICLGTKQGGGNFSVFNIMEKNKNRKYI